jgi:hypothetical protein
MTDTNTGERPGRIPKFAGPEEEAALWDTHDTTNFEDEFHPVTVVFEVRLADDGRLKRVEILLDAETDRALTALARRQGLQMSSLVRSVVQSHLRDRHRNSTGSLNARTESAPPR